MKRTATLLAIAGLALSTEVNPETFQDNEEFAPILAKAGLWAITHPQQIAKGVEVGIKAVPAVIGGTKKVIDWIQHHDDQNDDEFMTVGENIHDDEEFAPILVKAGIWAATHPQEVAKGVQAGIKAAPAVVAGVKKGVNWVKDHIHHHDELVEDEELFAPVLARAGIWAATHPQTIARGIESGIRAAPAVVAGAKSGANWVKNHIPHRHDDETFEDEELFAPIVARAGIWAATHPQQIAKGIEVGARAAPAVIGGVKKGYDWVKNHVHDDEVVGDDELFAPIVARAGIWAATHPQQIAKGVEVGIKAVPAVIGGTKKVIDWVQHHDDDEMFVKENVKPKRFRGEVVKSDLEQLGDLLMEAKQFRHNEHH
jgi:hypothetical protein